MDRVLILSLFFALTTSACAKPQNMLEQQVFPDSFGECKKTAALNKYIIRNKSGGIRVIEASSREEVLEKYIRPHINEVDFVESDQLIHVDGKLSQKATNSPGVNLNTWGADRIGASKAWAAGSNGQGVLVAVVDTAIDITHPNLADHIYVNLAEKNGKPGIDDDNNGYVDDINGWDFGDNQASQANLNILNHGTHVAGIIAASHTSSNPMLGMAPQATILPLQFITVHGVDSHGNPNETGYTSDAINAIEYAKKAGAKIINASWGSSFCSKLLQDEVNSLQEANILFVTAAGNSGSDLVQHPEFPAALDAATQLTVSAIASSGVMANFSNYGQFSDVMAPGVNILSTVPGGGFLFMDGTSMSSPFVAGLAALLLSANPNLSAADLKSYISQGVIHGVYNVKTQGEVNLPASWKLVPGLNLLSN
jgi:subtilisin family serine protease